MVNSAPETATTRNGKTTAPLVDKNLRRETFIPSLIIPSPEDKEAMTKIFVEGPDHKWAAPNGLDALR